MPNDAPKESQPQKKPGRVNRFKSGLHKIKQDLLHRCPSPKNDVSIPSSSSVQAISNSNISSSDPFGPIESETNDSKEEPYSTLKSIALGTLKLSAVVADASGMPGAPLVVAAITELVNFAEQFGKYRVQVLQLGEEAALYLKGLDYISQGMSHDGPSPKTDDVTNALLKSLKKELTRAIETMHKITTDNASFWTKVRNQDKIGEELAERTLALQNARQMFQTWSTAWTFESHRLLLQKSQTVLEKLQQQERERNKWDPSYIPYTQAAYDQDIKIRRCHKGTRTAILEEIYAQLSSSDPDKRIILLQASAGSGKSTISKTVAQQLDENGSLAGSFFFSQDGADRNGTKNVFATFANQFACRDEEFAAVLNEARKTQLELKYAVDSEKQLDELLIMPLSRTFPSSSTTFRPHIFVLDALDECRKTEAKSIVELLLEAIPKLPPSFRFFVTCRPEPHLISQFPTSGSLSTHFINVDDEGHVESSHEDIHTYFSTELPRVKDLDLSETDIKLLTTLANGLFQFAVTAMLMIMDLAQYPNPRETLDSILNIRGDDSEKLSKQDSLTRLYRSVFERTSSIPRGTSSYRRMVERHHLVVGGMIRACEPVSINMLAALVNLDHNIVKLTLQRFSSILLLPPPEDLDTPIRVRHATVTEYMVDPDGDLSIFNPELVIDNRVHQNLAEGTLSIAAKQLRFNISQSKSSFEANSAESLAHAKIPGVLAYACRFWGYHLEHTPQEVALDLSHVRILMNEKLLFWFEALSALRAVNVARGALVSLDERLRSVNSDKNVPPTNTQLLIKDAVKFIEYFAPVIAQSAPHTYLSTLLFAPTSSPVAQLYQPRFKNMAKLKIGQPSDWLGRQLVLHGHSDSVRSVAFSPDGKRVVSGSHDKTIRMWDAETGQSVGDPFQGHSDWVNSVAFSPDGKRVVSGSHDKTIRMWDAETGQSVGDPFQGHSDWVNSVAFSPDGKRIVSGSSDKTIRMWDAETGQSVGDPFQGHSDSVPSVAFSPDGKRVVSGSHDNTIRMWDAETGQSVGDPFQGHYDSVLSVAFSPDGKRVVSSSSNNTIRMWDAETGQSVGDPFQGHSSYVLSVAFSPDGKRVVSGSSDKTIRMWDAETGQSVGDPFQGHSSPVWSVAFSPDGKRVVSGSDDKTIRMWDAETGQSVGDPFQGHSDSVYSVAFSPDGKRVVSGSDDKTIRMWDAETGQSVGDPFQGHSDSVPSVAFSPDGKRVVSGSYDNTVRILSPAVNSSWSSFGNHIDLQGLHQDGWVRGPQDKLLLWVPLLHRQSFHDPYTVKVIGPYETRVDCSEVLWGTEWTQCYPSNTV